jgi:hypothetical protein
VDRGTVRTKAPTPMPSAARAGTIMNQNMVIIEPGDHGIDALCS